MTNRGLFIQLILIILCCSIEASYSKPSSYRNPEASVEIGATGFPTNTDDDTIAFQTAIDRVHKQGGGHVIVPQGRYQLMEVQLKSDVHMLFREEVVIEPVKGKQGNIFEFGSKEPIRNASLLGSPGRTVFDFSGQSGRYRAIAVNDCDNFHIANFTIEDNFTTFSSLILGWGGVRDGIALIGRNGLIENLTAINAHYGYGMIQAHSGESIVFSNIKSTGGVSVRLETGLGNMNKSGVGGLFDITVENVLNINGQGALMFQPHTMRHGHVRARNIESDGSEFAVLIAPPFVSEKKFGKDSGKVAGSFKSITIDGVKAVYRNGPIVTRYPHLKYYPEELHGMIKRVDNGDQPGYIGPSIAAVANLLEGDDTIRITHVEAIGFQYHPDIIGPADLFNGSLKHLGAN